MRRGARLVVGLALLVLAGRAIAQHPGGDPGQAPPPPPGPASLEVRVVHEGDPSRAGDLPVALYALGPDGTPGLASGQTDASGRHVFEGISNAPGIIYLIGVRYLDIPFGERVVFEPGQTTAQVTMRIADPTDRVAGVRVEELRARVDWAGDRLRVREVLRIVNPGDRVILRPGTDPATAILRRPLPATAREFGPGAASIGEGLAFEDGVVGFFGPLYPGSQRVEYHYSLPLPGTGDRQQATLPIELDTPAERVVIVAGTAGIEAEGPALVASSEVSSEGGEPLAAWARPGVAANRRVEIALRLPESRFDPALLRMPRGDVWLELDDTRLTATVDLQLEVEPGAPVSGTPDAPLLHVSLPKGARLDGVAPEAEALGLVPTDDGGFDVIGPVAPGRTSLGYAYRLPAGPEGVELDLRFPREVETLNVLIADTGLAIDSSRLHRRRPFRNRTRNYLHREAFNVGPEEVVDLSIVPLQATGVPRSAAIAFALAGAGAAALFLVAPLRRDRDASGPEDAEPGRLRAELEAVYAEIHDLDHDHETGKLEGADYERLREALRQRAITLLRAEREGAVSPGLPNVSAAPATGTPARAPGPSAPETSAAAAPPSGPAAAPMATAARFCVHCGEAVRPEWRFCSHCGGRLEAAAEPAG